jgi:hypothetical protein
MGAQLVGYFEKVGAEFGAAGRMKLAMLTLITSAKAGSEADSAENIRKFEEAIGQLRRTLKK